MRTHLLKWIFIREWKIEIICQVKSYEHAEELYKKKVAWNRYFMNLPAFCFEHFRQLKKEKNNNEIRIGFEGVGDFTNHIKGTYFCS